VLLQVEALLRDAEQRVRTSADALRQQAHNDQKENTALARASFSKVVDENEDRRTEEATLPD
jgi:hypothetical protein